MDGKITNEERQELLILLQNHSNLRTGQDQVLWNIFGAFWTANSLLLVSIFAASSEWNQFLVGFIVSFIGVLISLAWNHIQKRTLIRIEKYEDAIIAIEEKLRIEDRLCSFFIEGSNSHIWRKKKGTARFVMRLFSKCSIFIWLGSTITFIVLLILYPC